MSWTGEEMPKMLTPQSCVRADYLPQKAQAGKGKQQGKVVLGGFNKFSNGNCLKFRGGQ
jgi:hypothetical protein